MFLGNNNDHIIVFIDSSFSAIILNQTYHKIFSYVSCPCIVWTRVCEIFGDAHKPPFLDNPI